MELERRLTLAFCETHPLEAARHLERLEEAPAAALLGDLPAETAAGVLRHMLASAGARLLAGVPPDVALEIGLHLPPVNRLTVLRAMAPEAREPVLERLETRLGGDLRQALRYPEQTVGALMDPTVFIVPPDITAAETLRRIAATRETVTYYVYVVDREGRLDGVFTLKELLKSAGERLVSALGHMPSKTLPVGVMADSVVDHPYWHDHPTLPVVTSDGRFAGALRYSTLHEFAVHGTRTAEPAPLSSALMELWELYAMAGLGTLTSLAQALSALGAAPPATPPSQEDLP